MSHAFSLTVEHRTHYGKGVSRRLRREQKKTLGIIYGGKTPPLAVAFEQRHIVKLTENEAFFTSLVSLDVNGKQETVVVKDVQRQPATNAILHVDFMRVSTRTKITMTVPLHFINEPSCPGVKVEGGIPAYAINDIEISCLPADLPEYIEVDMANMALGDNIHLADLTLAKGVESLALIHGEAHNLLVCSINMPRGGGDDEDGETTVEESGADTEKTDDDDAAKN